MPPGLAASAGQAPAYHRVLRGCGGAAWRLVAAVAAGFVGLFVLSVVALTGVVSVATLVDKGFRFDLDNGVDAVEMLAINLGLALLIPFSWMLAAVLYREPRAWLGSVAPGIRPRRLRACVTIAATVWLPLFLLALAAAISSRSSRYDVGVVAFVVVVLVTQPLQAAGEEYLFRGVLLQALGSTRLPTWACCAVDGVLFATAHMQFDPPLFADRLLLGVVFSFVVIRTGGLEASIALHAVKNLAVLIPTGLIDKTSDALQPKGDVGWLPFVIDAVLLAIAVGWMLHRGSQNANVT